MGEIYTELFLFLRTVPAADIMEDDAPSSFCCSITGDVMVDPVSTADGHSYERAVCAARSAPVFSPKLCNIFLSKNQ